MSNMHMRDKLRKVTEAAKNSEQIPESSKEIGLLIFFIFSFIGIFCVFALAFIFLLYGHWLSAFITVGIALLFLYIAIKIRTAADIPKL